LDALFGGIIVISPSQFLDPMLHAHHTTKKSQKKKEKRKKPNDEKGNKLKKKIKQF
jgi:hypothetical protein